MSVFDNIYTNNGWGFGSGHGSLPSVTKSYRSFLETFIKNNDITSIVDYGCGDWQFSKIIKWGDAKYVGVDIVPSVIKEDNKKYANDKISFKAIEPGQAKLPKGDLLIVKDVLQHLSKKDIDQFLKDILPNYKYALITNCIDPLKDVNAEIKTGEFRPLDLRKKPYGIKGSIVYDFSGPKTFSKSERKFFPAWKKFVMLVEN